MLACEPDRLCLCIVTWLSMILSPIAVCMAQEAPAANASGAAESMPELGSIEVGTVHFSIQPGLADNARWPVTGELHSDERVPPAEMLQWSGDAFLLPRLPLRYDSWGIRDDWQAPVLLRAAADVRLPPGRLQLMLRARGLGRLWVDGEVVASTNPVTRRSPDGEQPVSPVPSPPLPGVRPHGYHQQEVYGEIEVADSGNAGTHRVVLELIVGGKGVRTETGEVVVALRRPSGDAYDVLAPNMLTPRLPLRDQAVEPELERIEHSLAALDRSQRRSAAASMDDYWSKRHAFARSWVVDHPPAEAWNGDAFVERHPVDAFIETKLTRANLLDEATSASDGATLEGTASIAEQAVSILREHCFRCHGEKSQGGLKLDSRDSALLAGDSGTAAIVPGAPQSSELLAQVQSGSMPPTESGLTAEQVQVLEEWIQAQAPWVDGETDAQALTLAPIVDDTSFLRRMFLDTVGIPPSLEEIAEFRSDQRADKRMRWVERMLDDPRVAEHQMGFWQDLLAENPTLVNASMGSTGPFRWFLYEALRDSKPLDRMVTELILMRGSVATGGSAAFGLAGESDAPLADKAGVLASAFLGVQMQCARCHDSPFHSTAQADLYSLAAMLSREELQVPKTSRVPAAFFEQSERASLIQVTLRPDSTLKPLWTLAPEVSADLTSQLESLLLRPDDTREQLALLITAPTNKRFARVMVNRLWQRLMGAAIVEPMDDWEGGEPSHPQLVDWLARQLIIHDYDMRALMRIIMTSEAYQREAIGHNREAPPASRYLNAPDRRRMSAEQVVDALHSVTGKPMDCEELTFVHDGARPLDKRQTLGVPTRAWMMASLNNERDRPSLSLPRARAITDVLKAFGWDGARQRPISQRDTSPNVLQPGILANGTLVQSLVRPTLNSRLSELAFDAESAETLVQQLFWQLLTRPPTESEVEVFVDQLSDGFAARQLPDEQVVYPEPLPELPLVTWFNHLRPETTLIQQEHERRVAAGPVPDPRMASEWRERYEDVVWSLVNHYDFVWIP